MKKSDRILYPVAFLVAFILVYTRNFGGPTWWILQARNAVRDDPTIARVPVPLADTSPTATPGITVSEFGYQFEAPWVATVKTSGDYLAVILASDESAAMTFFNPAQDPGLVKSLRQGLKDAGKNPAAANLYLDASSDYDLERSIWYATPGQFSLFFPTRKDVLAATRLMTKQSLHPVKNSSDFAFSFGSLRGFQFGNPSETRSVRVEAFDEQDRKFQFVFSSKRGNTFTVKQGDINRVLQTLHKLPAQP